MTKTTKSLADLADDMESARITLEALSEDSPIRGHAERRHADAVKAYFAA